MYLPINSGLLSWDYHRNYGTRLVLHWVLHWRWGINADVGFLWIFKRPLVSLLGRQRSHHQSVWILIVNIQANRVATVSSVITAIFIPASIGQSQFKVFEQHSSDQCFYCLLPIFFFGFVRFSAFVRFGSFVQYLNYSVCFLSWSWKCIPGILIL
jgi:hypothetical protein